MRIPLARIAFFVTALLPLVAQAQTESDVTLKVGKATVTGKTVTNIRGEKVNVFRAIPYAEPPTGTNRWKPSKLRAPSGDIDATAFKNICYTSPIWDANPLFPQSEDCLFLNVYAPAGATTRSKLPVMVWTHGGGWSGGNGYIYDGRNLVGAAGNPVVVVSFNYRLGIFGFLGGQGLLKEGNGANVGMSDMTNAYQWVRHNIQHFGGDPNDITAFGESAGAFMISLQLITAGGYQTIFDKAIIESGGYPSFAQLQSVEEQNSYIKSVAETVGCTDSDPVKVLACFRTKDATALALASQYLEWRPIVDGKFLTEVPYKLVDANKVSKIPTIIGTNTDEGFLFTTSVKTDEDVMPFFTTWLTAMTSEEFTTLESLYPKTAFASPTLRAGEMLGDIIFVCPSEKLSEVLAQCEFAYRYRFNETEPWFGPPVAYHSAEMKYIFDDNEGIRSDVGLQGLINNMQKFWTNFARYTSPNGWNWLPLPAWPLYGNVFKQQIVLQRGSPLKWEKNGAYMPNHDKRCVFWNKVEARIASGSLYKQSVLLADETTASREAQAF